MYRLDNYHVRTIILHIIPILCIFGVRIGIGPIFILFCLLLFILAYRISFELFELENVVDEN